MPKFQDMYCLLDLSGCIYHAYYGANDEEPIINGDGEEVTTAAAGFNAFLDLYMQPILEIFQPRQIYAAIDRGEEYQLSIYSDYKQQRGDRTGEEDPVKRQQIEDLKDLVKRFLVQLGATLVGVEGVEADDVLTHLIEKLPGYKQLYTVDTDFLQLIGDGHDIDIFIKGEMVEPELGSYKIYECDQPVPFKYWRVARSILGKSADNYKGIPGLGGKAVDELITTLTEEQFMQLEECVRDGKWELLDQIPLPTRVRNKMQENQQAWHTSYLLACLHPDLCWKPRNRKIPKLSWVKRIGSEGGLEAVLRAARAYDRFDEFKDYLPVQWLVDANNFEESDIEEFSQMAAKSPCVSFDYESWSELQDHEPFEDASSSGHYVDVLSQKITGCSFNFGENLQYTMYVTVDHADSANLPKEIIAKFLKAIPSDVPVVAQNAPFEVTLTKTNLDMDIDNVLDTRIMQVYVDEDSDTGLKKLSKRWLNYNQISYEEVTGGLPMNQVSAKRVLQYGCDDSLVTGRIFELQRTIMLLENTWGFYEENEPCTANVLAHSYIKGNPIDWMYLDQIHKRDVETYTKNHQRIHELLRQHCQVEDPEAAKAFFEADQDFHKKSMRDAFRKGKIPAKLRHLKKDDMTFAEFWPAYKKYMIEEYTRKTRYVPYKKTVSLEDWVPTKTNLFKLVEDLGFGSTPRSYSAKQIKMWAEEHLDVDWINGGGTYGDKQAFLSKLMTAAGTIVKASARAGKPYEEFVKFSVQLMGDKAPVKVVEEGDEINLGSPQQLQELLYLKLRLPVRLRGKVAFNSKRHQLKVNGSPSTNQLAVNWALAEDVPEGDWRRDVLDALTKAKAAQTQISLFDTKYPLWKHPYDGNIHPSVINCGASATKRMSGTSPNIMQVSAKSDLRNCFLPWADDHIVIGIDWAGQELRLAAGRCKDETMLSAYIGNKEDLKDLHCLTGAGLTDFEYMEFYAAYIDEDNEHHKFVVKKRKLAKVVNFGIIYLVSAPSLSQQAIIPEAEAEKTLANTFKTYPGLKTWQENVVKRAKKVGYSETFFGVRKHATARLWSSDGGLRGKQERQLVNYEIQGSAADMLKRTFSLMWKTGIIKDCEVGFILPVHDEVVASVPRKHALDYIRRMRKIMTLPVPGCIVPMDIDVAISSKSWGECHEIGSNPTQLDIDRILEKEDAEAQDQG